MKNLYKKINIDQTATEEEIKNAMQLCSDQDIKADCSNILLKNERKYRFDRLNNNLILIGKIRSKLCLTNTDHWNSEKNSDYFEKPSFVSFYRLKLARTIFKESAATPVKIPPQLVLFLGIFVFSTVYNFIKPYLPEASVSTELQKEQSKLKFNVLTQPPPTGRIEGKKGEYPFGISAPNYQNCLVKLENVNTGDTHTWFLRRDEEINDLVPRGTYTLKYASGENWYSQQQLFGPETYYGKATKPLLFEQRGQKLSGHSIVLQRVRNGNLKTNQLAPEDF